MRVLIPTALHSYTGAPWVDAHGVSLSVLLDDLDRRFPGIRFRMIDEQGSMRAHIRFFVNGVQTFDLQQPLAPADEIFIVQALSGG